MADLTDSFCERCGTRYSFTEEAPRGFSLKGARVLAKGLRNFVLTDGQSMSDAIENARLETNTESSSRVTQAFHATFNFCMVCRQYACGKCWNVKVGACLSCAPETNVRSVSPQDHLIVRTPVARWDGDWAITPDGPVLEALLGQDSPAPTKPQGIVPPPLAAGDEASAAEWPGEDLLEQQMAAISKAKATRATQQNKQVEPGLGTLWAAVNMTEAAVRPSAPAVPAPAVPALPPTPTPTALPGPAADSGPEMALTPQELMLIRAELSPNDDFPPPTFVDRHETPSPREVAAQWLSTRQAAAGPAPESVEPAPPARLLAPAPTPLPQALPARAADQSLARTHSRRRNAASESTESWPHATPWADRPLAVHDEWLLSQPVPQAQAPLLAQPHVRRPRAATPAQVTPAAVVAEAGDTAAAQLLAVPHSRRTRNPAAAAQAAESGLIGAEPTPGDASRSSEGTTPSKPKKSQMDAVELPAWPAADTDVTEAVSRRLDAFAINSGTPASPAQGRPGQAVTPPAVPTADQPAHPWPPLGSRYTPPQRAETQRPAAEPQFPAQLAAQQPNPPLLDEMWAQSSQEVMDSGTVRVCGRCALPVSTQARFCRRCGTPQV